MKVLIAGASRGIGKFLAESLSSSGNDVYGTYNSSKPEDNTQYHLSQVDVTIEAQVTKWIDSIKYDTDDRIVLINCVGTNYNSMLHKSDTEKWMEVIDTNLKSSYLLMKYTIPVMRERKFGRIILFSSVVPKVGVSGTSAYSASKAALWGLTKATAKENARFGITINALNLGYFDIGMISEVPEELLSNVVQSIPVGKLGDPVNILNTIEYLIKTDYMTGSEINVNGGMW